MHIPPKITKEDIRAQFKAHGFNELAENIDARILTAESISKALADETDSVDLLILGHSKMSTFKANFFDSVDEGIVNKAHCPVLVVSK